ncbi:AraC family transcriptional regulator [Puia sp.]|jgi:AraC-like DNA-binding protein|uniref:AraC family transcriptional regulator n=1 Tax=Puia sp. TaxID=2045100 RepID=UPI002F428FF9
MLKKKEGFAGQRSIVLPRKILTGVCHKQPLIERLYVTDIGYYPKAQYHYRQRAHGIDQHILIYCAEGRGNAVVSKKKYELEPGSFIIIPAGEQHSYSANEKDYWTIYWVHFKGSDAQRLVSSLLEKTHHHQGSAAFEPRRISLFEDIYACLERGYGNDNLCYANVCLHHYIASFIYQDKFNLTDNRQGGDAVEQSINFMRQNLGRALSLEELAGAVNFSASHYSVIFRKKTGFSPIEYFNHLKVQKACQYLLYTELRIKEIADKLGIEDPFYFSRMFNKLMGMSPNQYRGRKHL